jgi:hypothetical protein
MGREIPSAGTPTGGGRDDRAPRKVANDRGRLDFQRFAALWRVSLGTLMQQETGQPRPLPPSFSK